MKIGLTAEIFPPAWEGGRSYRIYETAKALALLGHEVHVYCHGFHGAPKAEFMEGMYVHRVGLKVPSIMSYFKRVVSTSLFLPFLSGERFDVLNANTLFPAVPTYLVSRIQQVPIVFTTDGLLYPRLKRLSLSEKGWLMGELTIWLEEFVSRMNYDAVIVVSNYVKQEMVGLGIPTEKVHVVYSGVNLELYDSIREPKKEDKSIVFVGNLLPHKGVKDLIYALQNVKKEFPEVVLNIIGSGPMLNPLKVQVSKLRLKGNVFFYGRVSEKKKIRLIKSSKCLVLPSIMESFGLVFLEAMACEKPVIAYDIPATKETILDGHNGFLVPQKDVGCLSDRMAEVLCNDSKAKAMGRRGRRLVEREFTWQRTAEKTLAVYRKVLQY